MTNAFPLKYFDASDFRLLFLDIDGVLNSSKTAVVFATYPYSGKAGLEDGHAFDKVNVKLVDKLISFTDTHIVLSSSWRIGLTAVQTQRLLEDIGIDGRRVIGRTRDSKMNDCRGQQIFEFLELLRTDSRQLCSHNLLLSELAGQSLVPKSFAILDDDSDMLPMQEPNFVCVDPRDGLTVSNVEAVGSIITGRDFSLRDLYGPSDLEDHYRLPAKKNAQST